MYLIQIIQTNFTLKELHIKIKREKIYRDSNNIFKKVNSKIRIFFYLKNA